MRKTIVHVNKHVIAGNQKHGRDDPALTIKDYKTNRRGHQAVLVDAEGNELGRFVHSEKPLPCGARVWFETNKLEVKVQ